MKADDLKQEVQGPLPPRIDKLLDLAEQEGWFQNSHTSLVVRLSREDAVPFFARWDMIVREDGRRSWRFVHAWAKNTQPLSYSDISIYLKDPSVIYPEPPEEDDLASQYAAWQKEAGAE